MAVTGLRQRIVIEGLRTSYVQNCESMQRVHRSPAMRNVISFLHAAFALAVEDGWVATNPVTRAARAVRRSPERLAAAVTGLGQSELLSLRWKDVDWSSRRVRVRMRGGLDGGEV